MCYAKRTFVFRSLNAMKKRSVWFVLIKILNCLGQVRVALRFSTRGGESSCNSSGVLWVWERSYRPTRLPWLVPCLPFFLLQSFLGFVITFVFPPYGLNIPNSLADSRDAKKARHRDGWLHPRLCISLNSANVGTEIDAALQQFVSYPTRRPPKLILGIIPYVHSSIYKRIKFVCDVKISIFNVCTVDAKLAEADG